MSINYEYCYKHHIRSKNNNLSNQYEPPNHLNHQNHDEFHQHNQSMNGNTADDNIVDDTMDNIERRRSSLTLPSSTTSMVDGDQQHCAIDVHQPNDHCPTITTTTTTNMVRSKTFHPSSSDIIINNTNNEKKSKLQRFKKRLSSHFECLNNLLLSNNNNDNNSLNNIDYYQQQYGRQQISSEFSDNNKVNYQLAIFR